MSRRSQPGPSGRPMSEKELLVYDCLSKKRNFMKAAEIRDESGIGVQYVIPTLDKLYSSRLIMARFILRDKAIIVTCEEVGIPEIAFSRRLDRFLTGIGMNKENWLEVTKDYAVLEQDGGFPDFVPDGIGTIEPYPISV